MRYLKILTLAMVAAIAAMAFIGAGTASAKLCKDKACTGVWQTPTTVLVSSPETKLTASFATVTCESHATLVHEKNEGGKLLGSITLLDWTNCKGCTTVETTANGTFEDEATGEGNGKLHPVGTVVLLKNCPLGAECTASSNSETFLTLDGGTFNGSGTGTAVGLANTKVAVKGFGCGTSGTWKAEKAYAVLLVKDSTGDYTEGSIFQI